MKFAGKIALIASLIAIATLATFAQDGGYLDLTNPAPRLRVRRPNGEGGFFAGGSKSPELPEVIATLVSLDKRVYSIGESVTFEVRIENSGKESIWIPWISDLASLEPSNPTETYTYLIAAVNLNLRGSDSKPYVRLWRYFYGSDRVAGTVRELRPGQSVVIRARGELELYQERWGDVQPLTVKATAGLTMNTRTYLPNEKGDSATENTTVIPFKEKFANEMDVVLWPRSN